MPGPPPPSKSYLLKFDTSSEEEDDDHEPVQIESRSPLDTKALSKSIGPTDDPVDSISNPTENPNAGLIQMLKSLRGSIITPTPTTVSDDAQSNSDSNGMDIEESQSQAQSSAKKKRKKKRKKKKKKTSGGAGPTQSTSNTCIDSTTKSRKRVSFDSIHVSEFKRDIGGDGVPADGGWPLTLSNKLHRKFKVSVDDFETRKQTELRERYERYVLDRRRSKLKPISSRTRRKRSNSKHGDELKKSQPESVRVISQNKIYIPETFIFETRQFDHKERFSDRHREEGKDSELEWKEIHSTGRNMLFGQLCESKRKSILEQSRSEEDSDGSESPKRSKRKGSISEEVFCSLEIKHIRNELEQIRIHRSAENAAGCSCRKLHVVLPSELNGGKKSHHHRRLTERKVKEELRRRHISIPSNAKREELELLLHDEVEKHGCCYGNDCPCSRSGIGCQSDTCSCWHMSHIGHKKVKGTGTVSPADAQVRCGNRNGIYMVDFDAIEKYRNQFLHDEAKKGFCIPVDA